MKKLDRHSCVDIANKFIEFYKNKNESLSHRKLQSLVYLSYGFYLAFENKKLFNERLEAWIHGPVCRDLYYKIKKTNDSYDVKNTLVVSNQPKEKSDIINQVALYIEKNFGKMTANQLEELTCLPSGAWYKAYNYKDDISIELQDEHIRSEINFIVDKTKKT